MASPGPLALGAAIAVVGGLVGFKLAGRQWRLRREIKSAASVDAGSLRSGVVELEGTAVPAAETYTAPLTGRECLAYQYEVEEKRVTRRHDGGGKKSSWRQKVDRERAAPFYVDDGTGRALVDAPVAAFELEEAHEVEVEDGTIRPTGRLKAMVTGEDAGYDMPISDRVQAEAESADRDRRYREHLILPEESVYVYGEAMPPAEARDEESGLATLAGLVSSFGPSTLSSLGRVASGATGNSAEYRRSSRRDPENLDAKPEYVPDPPDSDAEFERRQERLRELRELGEKDPEELTAAERRRVQELVEEAAPGTEGFPDSLRSHLGNVAEAKADHGTADPDPAGPADSDGTDPFAREDLVVSRGDTIGEFVVSDHEKGTVVRSYTKGTLKWLAIALASVAVGGYLVAGGLGFVSIPGPRNAGTLGLLATPIAGSLAVSLVNSGGRRAPGAADRIDPTPSHCRTPVATERIDPPRSPRRPVESDPTTRPDDPRSTAGSNPDGGGSR